MCRRQSPSGVLSLPPPPERRICGTRRRPLCGLSGHQTPHSSNHQRNTAPWHSPLRSLQEPLGGLVPISPHTLPIIKDKGKIELRLGHTLLGSANPSLKAEDFPRITTTPTRRSTSQSILSKIHRLVGCDFKIICHAVVSQPQPLRGKKRNGVFKSPTSYERRFAYVARIGPCTSTRDASGTVGLHRTMVLLRDADAPTTED